MQNFGICKAALEVIPYKVPKASFLAQVFDLWDKELSGALHAPKLPRYTSIACW
jgi:hypothetical protein